jgi:hypothetical protein
MRIFQSQHRCLVHEVLHISPGFWLPTLLSEVGQLSIYEQWLNPSRLSLAPVHLEPELLLPGAMPVAPGNFLTTMHVNTLISKYTVVPYTLVRPTIVAQPKSLQFRRVYYRDEEKDK